MTGPAFPAGVAKKEARPPVGTKGAADWYWKRYTELYPKYFWADDTKLADIVVASAKGSLLYDVEGKEFIDLTSQWATNNLGNVHPEILKATVDALERYGFLILFMNPHLPMIDVAERLLSIRPSDNLTRVFLELSGTGAAQGAVKHAIEVSGRPVALEAGVWIPPKNFVRGLRKLADEHGWFFIADEVEAGLGRTGKMWGIEHFGVAPDLVSIGKALGGGLMPLGAVLGDDRSMGKGDVVAGVSFVRQPARRVAGAGPSRVLRRKLSAEAAGPGRGA